MHFEYPKRIRFKCERCGLCCGDTENKARSILLLNIEAKCISKHMGKCLGEFAEKIEGSEPYVYRMKKNAGGMCVFLKERFCTIYGTRPLICRFYPFQLDNIGEDRYVFTCTDECPSVGKGPQLRSYFFEELFNFSSRIMLKNSRDLRPDSSEPDH